MKKPQTLRTALTQAIPALAADPERLTVFVDQGSVNAVSTASASFTYRYKLNVLLMDFVGDPDVVMIALLEWARQHEPDLLAAGNDDDTLSFEVDMLSNDTYDLAIKLSLTESIVVSKGEDGKHVITHSEAPRWDEWCAS
ncbi:phage tail protein [Robbsia andropogonis]|uniref:phage tail protein n=1 Tax=Robbsia andropogonis TaxID=28092 RepID=UPI00209D3818|nr:phage tail protein [Robbsia andropogonis]MCP1126373.1 phage tail protein [Robbsia andropogonis]